MSDKTNLYFIRHGETVSNEKGIVQGHYDAQLSELGKRQAVLLAKRFSLIPINYIFSSDLSRAQDTAYTLGNLCNLPITVDARLREVDMGIWSNRLSEDVAREYPSEWARSKKGDPNLRRGGGETAVEVMQRMVSIVDEVVYKYAGQTIVVVSHSIAIRAYLAHYLGMSLEIAYQRLFLSSVGVVHLQFTPDGKPWKMLSMNDVSHLINSEGQENKEGY